MEQTLNNRKTQFLGHILRAHNTDPIRAITFEHNSATPINIGKRRVGGPRQHWATETLLNAWKQLYPNSQPMNQNQLQETILADAILRKI